MDQVDKLDEKAAASVFEIMVASGTVELADGRGDAAYSVRNLTSRPLRAKVAPVPTPPALVSWLTVDQPEQNFSPGVLQQVPVHVQVPAGVAAGTYAARLDVTGDANPDEEFAHGPTVTFTVPPTPVPPPPPDRRWLIVVAIVAAVVLIGGGIAAFLFLRPVDVPDVVGKTQPDAVATLQAGSLKAGTPTPQVTGKPENTVLQQNPAGGTPAPRNSVVDLVVEAARVAVPNLVGSTRGDATQALTAVGLALGTVTDQPTGKPPGTVIQQNPTAGTPVLGGSAVNLVLESPLVSVPNVLNQPQFNATRILISAGLRVGTVTMVPQIGPPNGTVVNQNPGPGAQVLRNSAVNLTVTICQIIEFCV